MPPNFDNVLTIDEHECLSPAGPLELEPGETVLRLDAWVLQPGGACMAFLLGPLGRKVSVEARFVIAREPKPEGR